MAYIKGIIPKDKVPNLLHYLGEQGFNVIMGKSVYELGQVLVNGRHMAITVNNKGVVGIPEDLEVYVIAYLQEAMEDGVIISDTKRLDFMLDKHRKVIFENVWGRHTETYVEEGFMADRKYAPVVTTEPFAEWSEVFKKSIQRQAIDLAITEFEQNEKSDQQN